MALFRRDKSRGTTEAAPEPTAQEQVEPGREHGPWDRTEVADAGGRLDLGGLMVPGIDGMEIRLEMDPASQEVVAVTCAYQGSSMQLQGFAAPKTLGIWDDIRDELARSIENAGGTVELRDGVFGAELAVRMPSAPGELTPARFLGVDGPRWFLRGFLTGPAAHDDEAAQVLLAVFADVVVVRGEQAMAPRELLPLQIPAEAQAAPDAAPDEATGPTGTDDLQPFERGPEITETR